MLSRFSEMPSILINYSEITYYLKSDKCVRDGNENVRDGRICPKISTTFNS